MDKIYKTGMMLPMCEQQFIQEGMFGYTSKILAGSNIQI